MCPPPPDDPPDTARALVEAITAVTATDDRATALQCVVDQACRLTGVPYGAILVVDPQGRPAEMYHHGENVDGLATTGMGGTPISVRGRTLGLLYLADHDDGTGLGEQEEAVVRALVSVAGYVLEHAVTQAAAERRRVWQNHVAALSSTLQPPFDFTSADRTVVDVAIRAGGAVAGTMARIVDGELVVTARRGAVPDWIAGEEHEAAVHAVLEGTTGETAAGHEHVAILAPLTTHLSPAGALALYFPADAAPGDVEVNLLSEFAEQSALALDRARAFQEREQMALVSDRDRIARELHDVVIQRLFATGLHLQKSRTLATDPELRERLSLSMQDLDQTIRAIRESIFDLQRRPRSSVRSALRVILDEQVEQLGFVPTVRTQGPVDDAVQGPALESLTEALRATLDDVAGHSGVTTASVLVHVTAEELVLEVRDDGTVPASGGAPDRLAAVRLTLEAQGGTLEVVASGAAGRTLRCRIPLA